jgi:hypothetical protein
MSDTVQSLFHLASQTQRIGPIELSLLPAPALRMSPLALQQALSRFPVAEPDLLQQTLICVRDVLTLEECYYNPLRCYRAALSASAAANLTEETSPSWPDCEFCTGDWHPRHTDMVADDFGVVASAERRFLARGNWARSAPLHGVTFGPCHGYLAQDHDTFVNLWLTSEAYIRRAVAVHPEYAFHSLFQNAGQRSAGTVPHTHIQICGRPDRHFGTAECIAATGVSDYWAQIEQAHREAGLVISDPRGRAWPNLVGRKERDITVVAATVADAASLVYDLLRRLIAAATNSFSLVMILPPSFYAVGGGPRRFAGWPVVCRLVDRGDARRRGADVGSMELLLDTPIIASDPFETYRILTAPTVPNP